MATFSDLIVTEWGARFMGRQFPCSVGRGGIGSKSGEGDGITPAGQFHILAIYARPDRTRFPALAIRPSHIWSDDVSDPAYNTLQKRQPYPYSLERMWRADPLYNLVVDLDYNRRPIVPGKGSAIFMHVWRKPRHPTEGCIAFSAADLHFILSRWTPKAKVIVRP